MLHGVWDIRLLGGLKVRLGANEIGRLSTRQTELLFAMLADRLGRRQDRAALIEAMWPHVEPDVGRNRLRVALTYLRRIVEPPGTPAGSVLFADRNAVSLSSAGCRTDVDEFTRCVERANHSSDRDERLTLYAKADNLYAGEFLADWQGDWVEARRAHYARLQASAQLRYSAMLEEAQDFDGAMRQVHRAIEADPLRETPRRRALRLLVQAGEVGKALEEYEQYRRLLKSEVGLLPTTELRTWIDGVRTGRVRPKAIDGEPAAESAGNGHPAPRQEPVAGPDSRVFLPPSLTSFVGRETEISELSEMLLVSRWITITGPGGIGKTRLATEVARASASSFGAGVFFVSVKENMSPSALLEAILRQIQLDTSSDAMEALRRFFEHSAPEGRNACLFLFDAFEHMPSAANQVLSRLLAELPNSTILVTSRQSLRSIGEHEYAIGPLPVPSEDHPIEAFMANPSVELFVERARVASPRFGLTRANSEAIVHLCRRLEGIPLALELAAARSGGSSIQAILVELTDLKALRDTKTWREPRHRSLHASLTASLNALPEVDRQTFFNLSVFRGSFDSAAASVVAGSTYASLERLADHSLLVRQPGMDEYRYAMLDMVREFGWSHLTPTEQNAVRERHANYFRQLMADFESRHLISMISFHHRLWTDVDNLRLAIQWTRQTEDPDAISRIVLGFVWLCAYMGGQREGIDLVRELRQQEWATGLPGARLEIAEGLLACFHEDPETASTCLRNALPVIRESGMTQLTLIVQSFLAYAEYMAGDFMQCSVLARECIDSCRDEDRSLWQAHQWHVMALALVQLGDLEEALVCQERAEEVWSHFGDHRFAGYAQLGRGRVLWHMNQLDDAWSVYAQAAYLFEGQHDPRCLAYSVEGLGRVATSAGRHREAIRLFGISQRIRDSIALRRDVVDLRDYESAMEALQRELGGQAEFEWKVGYGVSPSNVTAWIRSMGEPSYSEL